MKIVWDRNRWLRENRAGYLITGWGGVFPTTEKKMQRDLDRWHKALKEFPFSAQKEFPCS